MLMFDNEFQTKKSNKIETQHILAYIILIWMQPFILFHTNNENG